MVEGEEGVARQPAPAPLLRQWGASCLYQAWGGLPLLYSPQPESSLPGCPTWRLALLEEVTLLELVD